MSTASNRWSHEFERVLRPFLPSLGEGAPLPADADLSRLGLDSLRSIQLLFAVEDAFGVSFPDEMLGPALFATPEALWAGLRTVNGPGGDAGTAYDRVLEIVGRVLRRDIDVALDFFDNGASSLALAQVIELIRTECGADVWLTDALDAPDVASFAGRAAVKIEAVGG